MVQKIGIRDLLGLSGPYGKKYGSQQLYGSFELFAALSVGCLSLVLGLLNWCINI